MKKINEFDTIIDVLQKNYILAAVAIFNMKAYYVTFVHNKVVFKNEFLTFKLTKEDFFRIFSEYNFYLIEDKKDFKINQEFDKTTLKQ